MISHQTVKELGLKIEEPSKSIIVAATGTTSRPLGIIRNLPIRVQGRLIPLDVEVVSATSYSLLLGNDWSKKLKPIITGKLPNILFIGKEEKLFLIHHMSKNNLEKNNLLVLLLKTLNYMNRNT